VIFSVGGRDALDLPFILDINENEPDFATELPQLVRDRLIFAVISVAVNLLLQLVMPFVRNRREEHREFIVEPIGGLPQFERVASSAATT
jgi:hypothetical protein